MLRINALTVAAAGRTARSTMISSRAFMLRPAPPALRFPAYAVCVRSPCPPPSTLRAVGSCAALLRSGARLHRAHLTGATQRRAVRRAAAEGEVGGSGLALTRTALIGRRRARRMGGARAVYLARCAQRRILLGVARSLSCVSCLRAPLWSANCTRKPARR